MRGIANKTKRLTKRQRKAKYGKGKSRGAAPVLEHK